MQPKPGIKTSELWITVAVNLIGVFMLIAVAAGLFSEDVAGELERALNAIVAVIVPIVLAYVNGQYIKSRTAVKTGR